MGVEMVRGDATAFARRLGELKETGGLLLVTGLDEGSQSTVSKRLLGDPGARRHVFVLQGRERSILDERLPDSADLDESQIVERTDALYRSAASEIGSAAPITEPTPEDLDGLLAEIESAVAGVIDRAGGSVTPGELRICLDSLDPIVDGHARTDADRFLADLKNIATNERAMVHAVLPHPGVPESHGWLHDTFDAVVETRWSDGEAMERWRLPADDLQTAWFPSRDVVPD